MLTMINQTLGHTISFNNLKRLKSHRVDYQNTCKLGIKTLRYPEIKQHTLL